MIESDEQKILLFNAFATRPVVARSFEHPQGQPHGTFEHPYERKRGAKRRVMNSAERTTKARSEASNIDTLRLALL